MEPRIVKLTCETDNCINKGIAIELETESTNYFCGPCMQPITNVVEVNHVGEPEAE